MTTTTTQNTPLSVRLPIKTRNKLAIISQTAKRSRNSLIAEAVESYVESYVQLQEWQIEGVKKAIKEMDEGKWVDGDKAMAWMMSLGTDHELSRPSANKEDD